MDPTFRGLSTPTPSPQPRMRRFPSKLLLVVGAALVAIAVAVFLLIASNSNAAQPVEEHLSARLETLAKLVTLGQKNLTSETLKKVNSDVNIVTLSDSAALNAAFTSAGLKKVDKAIEADEADDDTFAKLETAKVNGQFDEAYKAALAAKLESTNALVKELYTKVKKGDLKTLLNSTYGHIQTLQNELAKP